MNYRVSTSIDPVAQTITQSVFLDSPEIGSPEMKNVAQEISRQVMHLRESGIRDALIQLGWTPPVNANETWQDRLRQEAAELGSRLNKLRAFLSSDNPSAIDPRQRHLLSHQLSLMAELHDVLNERIARLSQ